MKFKKTIIQGDSGGGMVFPRTIGEDQVYYLRGIVSNGRQSKGGCDLGFYTMFTNVQEYISHIKNAIREFPSIWRKTMDSNNFFQHKNKNK